MRTLKWLNPQRKAEPKYYISTQLLLTAFIPFSCLFFFFLRLIASYHLLTDCACLVGWVSVQIEPAERKQWKRREKTKGDAGGREAQAFSSPMMTLREQRQMQGLILIIMMWEIGIRKMRMWVRIFLVTDCILLQLDIMARKFQLAFISTAAHHIMILA